MAIVQRCLRTSRAGVFSLVLMLAAVCGAQALRAGDQPTPDIAQLVQEGDRPDQFMLLTFNRFSTVWTELNRTRLFKQGAADPNMMATLGKVNDTFNAKLKLIEALQPGTPAGYTLSQLGRIGPLTATFNFDPTGVREFSMFRIGHSCDQAYLRNLGAILVDEDANFMEQLLLRPNPEFHLPVTAYRVRDGWTVLQGEFGAKQLLNADRLVLAGPSLSEDTLLAAKAPAPRASRTDFLTYLKGDGSPWLAGYLVDFNYMAELAAKNTDQYGPKNPDLFGGKGLQTLRVREAVNADGRFEAVGDCLGVDLHKLLFFAGAAKPMAANLAKAVPEDAAIAVYANLDLGAIAEAGAEQFVGHDPAYAEFVKELKSELASVADGSSRWETLPPGVEKVPGPAFDQGFLWTVYDPDRLQDIEYAFTLAFGVKPGFKPTEQWARNVLHHQKPQAGDGNGGGDMEGANNEFKAIDYGGVTIYVSKRWRTECLACTNSALIIGGDLKFMKRMIKTLQNVEAQQEAKNNFAEWPGLQALAAKEGGNLCGYGVVRTPGLLNKYGRMAFGGLAMVVPGIETDMDWSKITAGMEPSLGVLTYTPEKGFKAHTVSELPVASFGIGAGMFGLAIQQMYEGRWWGQQEQGGEDDLPPLAGAGHHDHRTEPMPPDRVEAVVPAEGGEAVEGQPAEEAVPAPEVVPVPPADN